MSGEDHAITPLIRGGTISASQNTILPIIPNGAPGTKAGSLGLDTTNSVYVRGVDGIAYNLNSTTPIFTTLTVTGATLLQGTTTINGATTINNTLSVTGLTALANVTVNGYLSMPVGAPQNTTNLFNMTTGNGPPTSTLADGVKPGSLYYDDTNNVLYIFDGAVWTTNGTGSVSSITGTSNQIAITGTLTNPIVGLTNPMNAPGRISFEREIARNDGLMTFGVSVNIDAIPPPLFDAGSNSVAGSVKASATAAGNFQLEVVFPSPFVGATDTMTLLTPFGSDSLYGGQIYVIGSNLSSFTIAGTSPGIGFSFTFAYRVIGLV